MEGFGFVIIFIACVVGLIRRLNRRIDEPEIKPSFWWYVSLSIALGLVFCFVGIINGVSSIESFVGIWYFAWFLISLKAMFLSPRQLLFLPISYIVLGTVLWMYGFYMGDKADNKAPVIFGGILVSASIGTYLRAKKIIAIQNK